MKSLSTSVGGALRAALLAVIGLIAGCAAPPASPPPPAPAPRAAAPAPAPPAGAGTELGRSERLVIYQPGSGDTLRSIAARYLGSEEQHWAIADFNGIGRAEPGQPVVVPLKAIDPIGVQADQYQTVPILCYHRFGSVGGKMAVSPANFAAQLDWLARNGYQVIRLTRLVEFLRGKAALPKRSVVITFDDGYESVHRYALPLLKKHGFPATLFVYTDFVGGGDALSWPQLRELVASGLVDIGAHSKSHRNLIQRGAGESEAQYRQNLDAEARVPRELLERQLNTPVTLFAYPFGDANEPVLEALARQRYQLAVTVNPGGNAFFTQPMMLRRTMIFGDHDLEAFKARLQTSRSLAPAGAP